MSASSSTRSPNRLLNETSPYLLQHAYNPVDWYPWGEEAFARAAAEDRPILLSVGYSACHWCHVMERESFENEAIAAAMSRDFICIKVDREERPDVDAIYMNAVQLMTGQGGWPMTMFLTPAGKPFYGGTYFPPVDHYGRPGFPRLLEAVANAWKTQRSEIEAQGSEVLTQLNRAGELIASDDGAILTPAVLEKALNSLTAQFDRVNGGFGTAPKFPQPANLDLLLRLHKRFHREAPLEMVELTLQHMALGGLYDQLGGGFHRYSTDAVWLAPHFEKMLYDNAQLAQTYCRAYQITGKQFYRDIAEETLEYVLREMTDPVTGAFYSAQDADSEGEEGRFFVWTPAELAHELGKQGAALFAAFYDVTEHGNWEEKNILRVVKDASAVAEQFQMALPTVVAILDEARQTLLAAREKRIRPGLDDKALTAWNGLMLAAFAECGAAFERPDFLNAAIRNAEFLGEIMTYQKDGSLRLLRTYRKGEAKLNGYLEDYAYYIDALIHLYQATVDRKWLTLAQQLAESMVVFFKDPEEIPLCFYATSSDHEQLIQRLKDYDDNAVPAGNSVALETLLKLSAYTGDSTTRDRIGAALRRLAPMMEQHPYGFARLLGVVDLYLDGPLEIAIRGDLDQPATQELLRLVHKAYLPNKVLAFAPPQDGTNSAWIPLTLLEQRPAINGAATAYICRNSTCSLPITDPGQLRLELNR